MRLILELDAQAAGGHAGVRMIDASVLKNMDAVSERLQQRSARVVAKSTVGMGIGALYAECVVCRCRCGLLGARACGCVVIVALHVLALT